MSDGFVRWNGALQEAAADLGVLARRERRRPRWKYEATTSTVVLLDADGRDIWDHRVPHDAEGVLSLVVHVLRTKERFVDRDGVLELAELVSKIAGLRL